MLSTAPAISYDRRRAAGLRGPRRARRSRARSGSGGSRTPATRPTVLTTTVHVANDGDHAGEEADDRDPEREVADALAERRDAGRCGRGGRGPGRRSPRRSSRARRTPARSWPGGRRARTRRARAAGSRRSRSRGAASRLGEEAHEHARAARWRSSARPPRGSRRAPGTGTRRTRAGAAIDSITGLPNPSHVDGNTTRSHAAYASAARRRAADRHRNVDCAR